MEVANTPAYYDTSALNSIKGFILQTPRSLPYIVNQKLWIILKKTTSEKHSSLFLKKQSELDKVLCEWGCGNKKKNRRNKLNFAAKVLASVFTTDERPLLSCCVCRFFVKFQSSSCLHFIQHFFSPRVNPIKLFMDKIYGFL